MYRLIDSTKIGEVDGLVDVADEVSRKLRGLAVLEELLLR
jgi:hypothetical protein